MLSKKKYIYYLFCSLIIIFFVIPDPVQKPFRIAAAFSYFFVYLALLRSRHLAIYTLFPAIIATGILAASFYYGTFQTSLFNLYLSFFFFLFVKDADDFQLIAQRTKGINSLYFLSIISILLQFAIFRSGDGRPQLAYETNNSGAYLFLFFLFCDVFNKRFGKFLVIALSFLLLSRLLIFSIALFYIIRIGKRLLPFQIRKSWIVPAVLALYLSFAGFSVWYSLNMKAEVSYQSDISRVQNINDGSNALRFGINAKVVASILTGDSKLIWGYGDVHDNAAYKKKYFLMPHMELFDILVEFGVITLIFFGFFMLRSYRNFFENQSIEFIGAVLFYTLLLWIRFFLVPSFEAIFIVSLLYIKQYNYKLSLNQ